MGAATTVSSWAEANQRYLTAWLSVVRGRLTRHTEGGGGNSPPGADAGAHAAVREAAESLPSAAALDSLCAAFSMSPFERELLVLCAAIELDASFAAACAAAQGSADRPHPTFSLALAALSEPHWTALTPAAPLRYWHLIEIGPGEAITTSPLRIDERVLHYLAGVPYRDERIHAVAAFEPPPALISPSHRLLAERVARLWGRPGGEEVPVIHLAGADRATQRAVASAGCAMLGMEMYVMRAGEMPSATADRETFLRLWERHAVLRRAALFIEADEDEGRRADLAFLDHTAGFLLVARREPPPVRRRGVVRVEVDRLSAGEQRDLWHEALEATAAPLDGALDALVDQFNLVPGEIHAASLEAAAAKPADRTEALRLLWDACRGKVRPRLDDLAQRVDCGADWTDLVLPPVEQRTLRDIAAQVRHRTRVYDAWGFGSKGRRGLGISALFAGASGTGKTMAAEVLALELRLDLYRIDLSQVVSKYIGETEKNLRRVFDAAEAGGVVLLFDEADALFGKRSEVRDSHDRYANIEISYLLQRMESYRGLAILTTNMKSALDASFLRRLRFVVQFPFPDAGLRGEIWRRVFPSSTPVDGLDIRKLARLTVPGGNIRNIAIQAAFLAADGGEPVRMPHLLQAARREYAKLERTLSESEVGDWV